MTKDELFRVLEKRGIPLDSYSLDGGLQDDRLCLDRTQQGWIVYYSEMGKKTNEIGFSSEEAACDYFYKRITEIIKATGVDLKLECIIMETNPTNGNTKR